MSEVIKEWLLDQLGLVIGSETWNNEIVGLLIAKLLYRYDLITQEQLQIVQNLEGDYESTMRYIRETIVGLGIDLEEQDFQEVLLGKGKKPTVLLYELYLALHDKNVMHYVAERKMKDTPGRFEVEKVDSSCSEDDKFDNVLAVDLVNNADVIQWHKTRLQSIIEKCKASRQAYLDHLHDVEVNAVRGDCRVEILKEKTTDVPCSEAQTLNLTLEELLDEEERAKLLCGLEPDPGVSKKIIDSIKQKHRKKRASAERQGMMQRVLLKELWDKMLGEQREYFEGEFGTKLLKQSVYEQQMVTRLFEIRQQRDRMYENRMKLLECARDENENKFMSELIKNEKSGERERFNYYMQRERNLELHRRLYAAKLGKKAAMTHGMCLETLESIVDIATYKSDYNKWFCGALPRKKMIDLVDLFIKGQPIYSNLDNAVDILEYQPETCPEELEEIYIPEIERHNCIDEMKLDEYCKNYWFWAPETFADVDYEAMRRGDNIVGFIVHRLLLVKYPNLLVPSSPPMPKVNVAVCASGLNDLKWVPVLERLLQARKIKVIQMEDCINYCLGVWKQESTREYLDEVFTAETEAGARIAKKKDKPKKPDAKGSKSGKSKKLQSSDAGDSNSVASKLVQTPKLFPCEELVLTPAGDLGRSAYEVLNLGGAPNDNLMVAMFLEYLKSLNGIEGWVLINYPRTMEQVAVLEEALTAVPFPKLNVIVSAEDIVDLDGRDLKQNGSIHDRNTVERSSKIVPNLKPSEEPIYNTYLTGYIEIRSAEGDDPEEQYHDCFRTVKNDNSMNRFYMEQGCKYTLSYREMDFPAVKRLAKLIIGDYTLPPKTSVELFTDTVKYVEAEFKSLTDTSTAQKVQIAKKPKRVEGAEKKSKSQGSDKRGKATAVEIAREDKETQAPDVEVEEYTEEHDAVPPKPGDDNWGYIALTIPEEFAKILATIWENMESVYINDLKQLFFRERVLLDTLPPYRKFMFDRMRAYIQRPTDKQKLLREFQVSYNALDDDMRNDVEVKAELHMRVHEFKERLYAHCDEIQRENEAERRRLIDENWLTNALLELTNIFILFMQLEIDRCADTMQILNDYYTAMVTQLPCKDRPLEKVLLELIPVPDRLERDDLHKKYAIFIKSILVGRYSISYDSPYHEVLGLNQSVCVSKTEDYKRASQSVYAKLAGMFAPKKGGRNFEPLGEVKDRAEGLLQEFQAGYLGESNRALFKLHMAHLKGKLSMEEMIHRTLDVFMCLHSEIEINYANHLQSVDNACGIISRAIEDESKVQPELVFVGDQFFIKLDSVMYEGKLPEEPVVVMEKPIEEEVFTFGQLNRICDILFGLAPTGLIPERSFAFLLQDLIVCNAEDGKPPLVPVLWQRLRPLDTDKLMQEIFGDAEYIDWKDFIVYNLGIRFPTELELMEARDGFRAEDPDLTELVHEHQFANIKLWFEDDFAGGDVNRLKLLKELLIRMYKIDQSRINYTALLLSFCKDETAVGGLAKAVELSLGKFICWKREQGEVYYDWLSEEFLRVKVEEKDNELLADEILSDAISTAVHKTESAFLEDYDEETGEHDYPEGIDIFSYLRETTANAFVFEECESSSSTFFTNPSQGRESTGKTMEYYLDFDTLINVLTVALPWHARNRNIGDCSLRQKVALIYQAKYNREVNRVFTYQVFNEPEFVELIGGVYKFFVKDPTAVVKQLVNKE